jgi:glutathione S-transferase
MAIEPVIAADHRRRTEVALATLNTHLAGRVYLCAGEPTIADLFCYGDVAFAEVCLFELNRWTNVADWQRRVRSLPGFKGPFELLAMEDADLP